MIGRVLATVLDCPDPRALAGFYSELTGAKITDEEPDWVTLDAGDNGVKLAFQRVDDYQPPQWPNQTQPQQLHLDLLVDDMDAAQQAALAIGARAADPDSTATGFRVFFDPDGHPFCLCTS